MNPFIESTQKIILRDLDKLELEISSYPNQESLWITDGAIKNPAGNLCLHLCGNLRHFVGHILGGSGYVRDREKEFSLKDLPMSKLISEILDTKGSVKAALEKLDPSLLEKSYPVKVFEEPMTTMHFLIHLTAHLEYHLGQINYHRRLLTSDDLAI
jgi:Protein of unknown function (DUF1572)